MKPACPLTHLPLSSTHLLNIFSSILLNSFANKGFIIIATLEKRYCQASCPICREAMLNDVVENEFYSDKIAIFIVEMDSRSLTIPGALRKPFVALSISKRHLTQSLGISSGTKWKNLGFLCILGQLSIDYTKRLKLKSERE